MEISTEARDALTDFAELSETRREASRKAWTAIDAELLRGVPPAVLAELSNLTYETIRKRARKLGASDGRRRQPHTAEPGKYLDEEPDLADPATRPLLEHAAQQLTGMKAPPNLTASEILDWIERTVEVPPGHYLGTHHEPTQHGHLPWGVWPETH